MLLMLAVVDLFAAENITCHMVGKFNIGVKIGFYASGFSWIYMTCCIRLLAYYPSACIVWIFNRSQVIKIGMFVLLCFAILSKLYILFCCIYFLVVNVWLLTSHTSQVVKIGFCVCCAILSRIYNLFCCVYFL